MKINKLTTFWFDSDDWYFDSGERTFDSGERFFDFFIKKICIYHKYFLFLYQIIDHTNQYNWYKSKKINHRNQNV